MPAIGHVSAAMGQLFRQPEFTQQDLLKLTRSQIPEVREGAIDNLVDQAILAKIALEAQDSTPQNPLEVPWKALEYNACRAAFAKLTNHAFIAKIALEDKDSFIREHAVLKLEDQTLLTKIAVEDKDGDVRDAATMHLATLRAGGH
jgi:hypothetical protein